MKGIDMRKMRSSRASLKSGATKRRLLPTYEYEKEVLTDSIKVGSSR
jgi:hypothetical protein